MTNQERIEGWRKKRQAGLLPTDPQANALSAAFTRTLALVGEPNLDIRSIVQIALDGLPAFPDADRRELYQRMHEGTDAAIKKRSLSEVAADYWTRRVKGAVRMLEADLRKGVDVFSSGYLPQGLAEFDSKLEAGYRLRTRQMRITRAREERRQATREDRAHIIPVPADEAADLARLRPLLDYLRAVQRPTHNGTVPPFQTVGPLFLLRLLLIQADSRIALIWLFVGPLVIMVLWSSMYILNGMRFVLGMDTVTFTLTGVVIWVMLRQIVFRSSEAYVGARGWLNFEPLSPVIMSVMTGSVYFLVYIFVLSTMVGFGRLLGLISLPDDVLGVLSCIAGIAIIAVSMGILFASIASRWAFFMRFSSAIERFLQVFSGVFFVSEQLPYEYRKYFLWCPLAHGFQLLRSAYFKAYKSQDANLNYFLVAITLFVISALVADRLARPNLQPT
ncbi:ABC transporter permease [Mesorhizobium sophorae]|uniref:ABC transporter permease n=1 Tax=Mesorhizobium sophorae TaxID=1300294 RepID=UPI000BA44249|nr:sugar ABC transporter permease [Mesorhizobium sophorae]